MTENESNAEGSETSSTPVIPGGPIPGVKYPLVVHYCGGINSFTCVLTYASYEDQ